MLLIELSPLSEVGFLLGVSQRAVQGNVIVEVVVGAYVDHVVPLLGPQAVAELGILAPVRRAKDHDPVQIIAGLVSGRQGHVRMALGPPLCTHIQHRRIPNA